MSNTKIILVLFCCCFSNTGFTASWSFLGDTAPARSYTEQDWEILLNTMNKALDELDNGKKLSWNNQQTGHRGLIQPLSVTMKKGVKCRQTRFVNRSKNNIAEATFTMCKTEKNGWKVTK